MDTQITLVGNLTKDAEAGEGARPAKFRMACYVRGTGDDKVSAFVAVKWFDPAPDALDALTKGKRVIVVGRLDPWETKEGNQVLDVMAEYVGLALFTERKDDNGNGSSRSSAQRRPAPATRSRAYDDEEAF
jgi:single-stranded DNA-binding protein